jgi:hypothetical protein
MNAAKSLKAFLGWFILGATLFFLAKTLIDNWQEVVALRISLAGLGSLAIALGITLLALLWSGWVWGWIIQELQLPLTNGWAMQVYVRTNLAKYLPGNIWHFYGRVQAIASRGSSLGMAILAVVLEPLLLIAAALLLTLAGRLQTHWLPLSLALGGILVGMHPGTLNPPLRWLGRGKLKAIRQGPEWMTPASSTEFNIAQLQTYPWRPLLGEVVFMVLRGAGFLLTLMALQPYSWSQVPLLLSTFSFAWLVGFVVPGAPGGVGVFETTAIALLQPSFKPGLLLSVVALYRLISVIAEVMGVGFVWSFEQWGSLDKRDRLDP